MDLVAHFQAALPRMLADITELVNCESPSSDAAALARSAETAARLGERLLCRAPDRYVIGGIPHLRWHWPSRPSGAGRRVLLLAHHDTVWPIGSLAAHPCRADGAVLRGPGCFDMKTGIVMALHAVAALPDPAGVTLLVTGDEEVGSPTSRELIENEARACSAVLVLEGAAAGGRLKWARKGVSRYDLVVHGRAAHAGLEPESGINATVELARQVLAVEMLGDPGLGTTVTPTLAEAGTSANTVPARGQFAVDVRAATPEEQQRVDAAMKALTPTLPGASVEVLGGPNRPPMTTTSTRALFERAQALAGALGLGDIEAASVGGGSDGNFTAGLGIPTLDGLGAVGGGAHSEQEHVLLDHLPSRTALLTALIRDQL
ncbi:MAG: M20 family metallopeptidase [Streptosporangiaceae bacterium]